jgi:hypothetical protein
MASLVFTCPKTNQQIPTGIETDVKSLSVSWRGNPESALSPLRRGVHEISVRETYINGALDDAAKRLPPVI